MDSYRKENQKNWNDRTKLHEKSSFYDLDTFISGRSSLLSVELNELGDLSGKSMLHLQCHFGQDTLSWARRGVKVTGVDFSDQAIQLARSLNETLQLDARFVCSDVYDIPQELPSEIFDVVYTSYGVLCWLPDLTRWAQIIYEMLKPGGIFYIAEQHPLADIFEVVEGQLKMTYSYFDADAMKFESDSSYVESEIKLNNKVTYEWLHPLSKIVNALVDAGLKINYIHEFPFCMYEKFPGAMIQTEDGWWKLKEGDSIPMLFSIQATKI
ncbi:class I SAM-dependent methyltransferase [Paenibacillus eucommiae]|uniref:SAM-dependent methyltransferase n=1 Tax=Paenibacillus eucommiae TaxID=1355755 RepID=A0ABS4ITT7_9BACL|nr:class I SAM-dependent methyltransferase [Paenibacillus eucommiae]MBP1990996.1 SAM-dependent methyltransferase [Paenibacillus eucommiae]